MRTVVYNARVWQWISTDAQNILGNVDASMVVFIQDGTITKIERFDVNTFNVDSFSEYDIVVDAKHNLLLPGLIDSHIHIGLFGESQHYVNLEECKSIEDLCEKLIAGSKNEPDLPFVIGFNWDQSKLGRLPTRQDLDSLPINKPIFLWRACWHIGVANSLALNLAKIYDCESENKSIFTIDGGLVDIDENFIPTGILRERAVEPLMEAFAKFKTKQQRVAFLQEGMQLCVESGITCVQSNDELCYEAYQDIINSTKLPMRVFLTPVYHELENIKEKYGMPQRTLNSRFNIDRFKIFSDGSLGAETAAIKLLEEEDGSYKGLLIFKKDELVDIIFRIAKEGYRIEVHAIGDAAAEHVLDCFAVVNNLLGNISKPSLFRPILTHCQVLSAHCLQRMKEMNVVANIQPSFVPTDMRWLKNRLHPSQIEFAYAWKTLLRSNVYIAGGSDAPVEHPSPFRGIHDAIFRSNYRRTTPAKDGAPTVFREDEKLSFAEALWSYTIGGAYAAGCEDKLGRIEVGYVGDMLLVDPTILDHYERLHDIKPYAVFIGGQISHVNQSEDSSFPQIIVSGASEAHSISGTETKSIELTLSDSPYIPGKGGSFAFSLPYAQPCEYNQRETRKNRKKMVVMGRCNCCKLNFADAEIPPEKNI